MRGGLAVVALLATASCAALPEPIYPNQVRATFVDGVDPRERAALEDAAGRCAARLNGHLRAARFSGTLRVVVNATGALLGGVGASLGAMPGEDPTRAEVSLGLGVSGAMLGLVGTFVASITGEPTDFLARHARGLRSWDAARDAMRLPEVQIGRARGLLEICVQDGFPGSRPSR